ncbi:MAG: peptidoglycan editing factor PgeF [Deltaproteobacteria bacterium]|nr:peptidoglycan editing factor PgeF [Deltaproteobacteria bacterium]
MALALTSALLAEAGFRHGFFGRRGGVSQPPFESLNFSTAAGDDPAAVGENLARAAAEIGVQPDRVYYLSQVHGCDHRVLTGAEDREAVLLEQGDITLSAVPEVACAVRAADCAAVLLADRSTGSVAAVHSGWRGTEARVVQVGVEALRALIGGPGDLVAAVGPHIERCCFEVGPDVAKRLAAASDCGQAVVDWSPSRPKVDLRRIIEAQLRSMGVAAVDHVAGCTMCDPLRFHSYRRDGPRSGRMLGAILVRPAAARVGQ